MNDLVKLDGLRTLVNRAHAASDPREIAQFSIQVAVIRDWVRKSGLALDKRQDANEASMETDAHLGKHLKGVVRPGPKRKALREASASRSEQPCEAERPKTVLLDHQIPLVDLLGIPDPNRARKLSSRAQQLDAIPEEVRKRYYRICRKRGWEISWRGHYGLKYRAQMLNGDHSPMQVMLDDQYTENAAPRCYSEAAREHPMSDGPSTRSARGYYKNDRMNGNIYNPDYVVPGGDVPTDLPAPTVWLYRGDCLEILPQIADHTVDLILADLPFDGTTHVWNVVPDLDEMWQESLRVLKQYRPMLHFSDQRGRHAFSARLMNSAQDFDIAVKTPLIAPKRPSDPAHANDRPLNMHHDILVFSQGSLSKSERRMPYYPGNVLNLTDGMYPGTILPEFARQEDEPTIISVQKPVLLYAFLIQLFSMPGDTVLDFTMGSGACGVAAIRTGRSFIGIEKELGFFEDAEEWLAEEAERHGAVFVIEC